MVHANCGLHRCALGCALLCILLVMMPEPLHAAAGDLDPTFGDNGKAISHLGSSYGAITEMVLQTDGRMVVVGGFGVAQLLASGEPDPTFGNQGITTTVGINIKALLIQPDGKLVAAGDASSSGNDAFALARYNVDGSLDNAFDGDGKVITDFGANERAVDIVLQPDGKLIVIGSSYLSSLADLVLLRYNADGSVDTSFGSDGKVTTNLGERYNEEATALILQPDGKLVAAGNIRKYNENGVNYYFALVARYNLDGSLDNTFDGDGKVITEPDAYFRPNALILQPNGKLVVAGSAYTDSSHNFTLVRFSADGLLDSSFGNDGKVHTDFGGNDEATTLVLQPDGKLIAAGIAAGVNKSDVVIGRYNADGSLDSSFDGDGKVVTDLGSFARAYTLLLRPDGKLVASISDTAPTLARYNTDGSLDATFGINGISVWHTGPSRVRAIAIQPDGKLVAGGSAANGSKSDFGLARYNANGSLDTSFGGTGKVVTNFGIFDGDDHPSAVVLQPDGKIVVAGSTSNSFNTIDYFALVRYNADGSLDSSFDADGKVFDYARHQDHATALLLQPDGKLVVAGSATTRNTADFAVMRFHADGSLDNTFDGDGKVVTNVGYFGYATALALQPDGKVVVAGWAFTIADSNFVVVRYNADGSLDNTFDGDGKVRTDFGANDRAATLVLQPDGKLVLAGETLPLSTSGEADFALVRYNTNGSLDSSFDGDGMVVTDLGGNDQVITLIRQPDGKLIAGGPGGNTFALVRYNTDGSLDTLFGSDGKSLLNPSRTISASTLLLQPDGKFVTGGQSLNNFALARYLSGNTAPVAVDDTFSVGARVVLTVFAPGVLGNDSDVDGNVLTVMQESTPSHGRLTLNIDGSFIYTPSLDFSAADTFIYRASDGQAISDRATITITAPTTSERLDLLMASLQQMIVDGQLNDSQGNVLRSMLVNVQQQLAQGLTHQALNMLHAIRNQVNELVASGVLTPAAGQPLIDAATVIISQLPADSTIYLPQVSR